MLALLVTDIGVEAKAPLGYHFTHEEMALLLPHFRSPLLKPWTEIWQGSWGMRDFSFFLSSLFFFSPKKGKWNYLAFVFIHPGAFRLPSFNFLGHCTSFWLLPLLLCFNCLLSFYRKFLDSGFFLHVKLIVGSKPTDPFIPLSFYICVLYYFCAEKSCLGVRVSKADAPFWARLWRIFILFDV